MNRKELIGTSAILSYFDDLVRQNTDDYLVNQDKYDRFIKLIKYCQDLEKQFDCELRRCVFNPGWIDGCVEMVFHGEWAVEPDKLRSLTKTLTDCDGINIASNPLEEDWIQVTFFITDLWKHK